MPLNRRLRQAKRVHFFFESHDARIFAAIKMLRHSDWKCFGQFGVAGAAMIAFAAIFHNQFPVGIFDQNALVSELCVFQIMRRCIFGKLRAKVVNGRRCFGQADENRACNTFDSDRF